MNHCKVNAFIIFTLNWYLITGLLFWFVCIPWWGNMWWKFERRRCRKVENKVHLWWKQQSVMVRLIILKQSFNFVTHRKNVTKLIINNICRGMARKYSCNKYLLWSQVSWFKWIYGSFDSKVLQLKILQFSDHQKMIFGNIIS